MGIQVLLDNPAAGRETTRAGILPDWFPLRSRLVPDADFEPKQLRDPYAQGAATVQKALVENLCDSLHGAFVRHKVDFPSCKKSRLLSLHFLVPRDSVETFRRAARHLPANPSVQLHLSGPWPPYNFVDALQ